MLVSVIIPTYNREKTLLRSIQSVLNQTFRDLELIVVDDCSTDGTAELVQEVKDKRVRYICMEHNQGACVARNTGIDAARGELVAFQDSDDVWLPKKLEIQIKALQETSADICYHKMKRLSADGKRTDFFPTLSQSAFVSHQEICSDYSTISTQTILAKQDVFKQHRFDPQIRRAQDFDWVIRASNNYTVYYLNEILVEQYLQNDSISMQNYRVLLENKQYLLNKYADECRINPQFEVIQLRSLVEAKTRLGQDSIMECKRIYDLSRKPKDYLRIILCKTGLLHLVYKVQNYRSIIRH